VLVPEYAPQSGVILTWPHGHSDWRGALDEITPVYIELTRAIVAHEHLLVICYDRIHRDTIQATLEQAGLSGRAITFASAASNDTWIRDYGPLVTRSNKALKLHDFTFDGWDGRHPAARDDGITRTLHADEHFGTWPLVRHALVLEGGSIETDGCGTLLTTSRCLLKTGRNPGTGRAGMESALRTTLGTERVLWLDHGEIIGDDTDGHIDMLARFCSIDTIAYSYCDRADDPHYLPLRAMAAQLQTFKTAGGQDYRLVPLPLPAPCCDADNRRLPASYANFLIINDAILMPAYNDPADDVAAQALQDCFPSRTLIPIDCRPLITQAGSLHCATLQLPAGVLTSTDD
jgi:agmatine/peptidylarginine deiminase